MPPFQVNEDSGKASDLIARDGGSVRGGLCLLLPELTRERRPNAELNLRLAVSTPPSPTSDSPERWHRSFNNKIHTYIRGHDVVEISDVVRRYTRQAEVLFGDRPSADE